MSLEAIEKVTQVENKIQERKAAAEAEARQIVAAEAESAALREAAGKHLEEAAEFIVGRVVKH